MPQWYTRTPETVREWLFGLTTVEWRENDLKERLKRSDDLISGAEPVTLKGSGEEGHLLIKALLGLSDLVSNVNIPNRGQIEIVLNRCMQVRFRKVSRHLFRATY